MLLLISDGLVLEKNYSVALIRANLLNQPITKSHRVVFRRTSPDASHVGKIRSSGYGTRLTKATFPSHWDLQNLLASVPV